MDDKEPKNIDGIINTDSNNESQPTTINVTEAPATEQSIDSVSVSDNGDVQIAEEPATTETITETQPVEQNAEENTNEVTEAPANSTVAEEQQDTQPITDGQSAVSDPGIVPSVQPVAAVAPDEVSLLKKKNKTLRVVLVVLIVLLVAITSALVVYFSQQQSAAKDLDQKNQQIASLQQQIADQQKTSTQATINTLTTELEAEKKKNAELTAEITTLNATISSYQAAAEKLISICGTKCNSVELPETEQPANNNTSGTNSNSSSSSSNTNR